MSSLGHYVHVGFNDPLDVQRTRKFKEGWNEFYLKPYESFHKKATYEKNDDPLL